jgi:hypothetical protein
VRRYLERSLLRESQFAERLSSSISRRSACRASARHADQFCIYWIQ